MDRDNLIKMANEIAAFFDAYPSEQAQQEVASHLKRFWDPRMRAELIACVRAGGDGLAPLVMQAVSRLA